MQKSNCLIACPLHLVKQLESLSSLMQIMPMTVTHRSVSTILIFINSTPIHWYSKHQKTIETLTYGAELVATRVAVDMVIE